MPYILFFIVVLLASFSYANAADLHTLVIQPGPEDGKDALYGTVYYSNGTSSAHFMTIGGWGDYYYSFIEFNISDLPENAEVVSAKLNLYQHKDGGTGNNGRLLLITEPWQEGEVSLSVNPSTYDYGDAWSYVSPTLHWWTKDVTSQVKDWYADVNPNYGFKIIGQGNSNDQGRRFYTSNYLEDPSLRPYLEITYTVPEVEKTLAEHVAELEAYIDSLALKSVRNSYTAHVKKIVGLFEAGEYETALEQIAALKKKIERDGVRGDISEADLAWLEEATGAIVAILEASQSE